MLSHFTPTRRAVRTLAHWIAAKLCSEATVEHWLCFCPIVGLAFTHMLNMPYHVGLYTHLAYIKDPVRLTRLIRLTASLRRALLHTATLSIQATVQPIATLLQSFANIGAEDTENRLKVSLRHLIQQLQTNFAFIPQAITTPQCPCLTTVGGHT